MAHTEQRRWRYKDVEVLYTPGLEGGGEVMTYAIVDFVRQYFGNEVRFGKVFEWCAGPGFIGFALLAEGLCDSLCLADINRASIDCVRGTIRLNNLEGRVNAYVSDNLKSVPKHESFDLVVGNPPNFCSPNSRHPNYDHVLATEGLRCHDPDWSIHKGFYAQIGCHLNPGAFVLVQEVQPYEQEVYFFGSDEVPFDIRPTNQATLFLDLMKGAGLVHKGDFELRYTQDPAARVWSWMQVSQKSALGDG